MEYSLYVSYVHARWSYHSDFLYKSRPESDINLSWVYLISLYRHVAITCCVRNGGTWANPQPFSFYNVSKNDTIIHSLRFLYIDTSKHSGVLDARSVNNSHVLESKHGSNIKLL